MKVCSKCKEEKPTEKFSPSKRNEDGSVKYRNSWCNSCRTVNNRERGGFQERNTGYVGEDEKECLCCREIKNVAEFNPASKNERGLGKSSYCKSCYKGKYYDKEKAKAYTYKYREENRATYLEKHRLRQFERKHKIKVQSDGSVTKEFIDSIYAKDYCYWCDQYVDESYRTLEHITELCDGGLHSTNNITMACHSCNSSRKNRRNNED